MSEPNRVCPKCRENGHDSEGDHLFLMTDESRWCCSKTEYHGDGQYYFEEVGGSGDPTETPETSSVESSGAIMSMDDLFSGTSEGVPYEPPVGIEDLPCVDYRGIPKRFYEKYGCHMELSEVDRSIQKVHYPVDTVCGDDLWKIRFVVPEKDFKLSELVNERKLEFIGQRLYKGQKTLLVCEGQDDAIASDFMLNGDARQVTLQTLCVSVPNGANTKAFKDNKDFLKKFDRVTFCPDNDEPGRKLMVKLAELEPDMKFMDCPSKDACDALDEGKQVAYVSAYGKAHKYRPEAIEMLTQEDVESLLIPVEQGLDYPWESLTKLTYGICPNTIINIGGAPSVGKSSLVRGIQQHLMFHHLKKIGIFSVEESKLETLRYLVGYMINERIHVPGLSYNEESAVSSGMSLIDKAVFFNSDNFDGEWGEIEKAIRYMYSEGVRHFFIDPVSALVAHLDPSAANTYLNNMMIRLKGLRMELPIWIMLVNHLNPVVKGTPHDEGGRVLPSQFTGSRAQWRFSTEMGGLERNSQSDDPLVKNTLIWRQLKHRVDGSKQGLTIEFLYNEVTGRLEEKPAFTPLATSTPEKGVELSELFSGVTEEKEEEGITKEVKPTIADEKLDSLDSLLN
jgi:twinkle protein